MKSTVEAFRGTEISDRELSVIIAGSITMCKRPEIMADEYRFDCQVCGKHCAYKFCISEELKMHAGAMSVVELEKRNRFREMGYKLSQHCPYALK